MGEDSLGKIDVLEVWPGPGDLTETILKQHPKSLTLIEIDDDMIPLLEKRFDGHGLTLYHGDVLETNIISGENTHKSWKITIKKEKILTMGDYIVYGNIPYYITSPILQHFLYEVSQKPQIAIFTMQKEVADRILARDGQHSVLSLSCHLLTTPIKICDISPENFVPVPKVWSTCLKFIFKQENNDKSKSVLVLIKLWFSQKRKKMISNLEQWYNKELLKHVFTELKFSENIRAEELSLEDWKSLYRELTHVS